MEAIFDAMPPGLTLVWPAGLDAAGLDLRGSYMRDADLRGIDFSAANLDEVSIRGARISGTLFPRDIPAEEIRLSWELGTRMRARRAPAGP